MPLPTFIDAFAGIGGLSLGFEEAGFQCLAGVEHNEEHRKIFCDVHPNALVDFQDATTLDPAKLLRALGLSRGELDVLVGGPPCQAFSMAGKRNGEDDERGRLIYDFVRILDGLRPRAFVMENVIGLQSIHGGRLLENVRKRFVDLGYTLSPAGRLNAADYGVPQSRRRLFVVGTRNGATFEFPRPTHSIVPSMAFPLYASNVNVIEVYVTVDDAITDLPCNGRQWDDPSIEDNERRAYNAEAHTKYQRDMRGRKKFVTGNQTSVHFDHIIDAISKLNHGSVEPRTRYRRLYPDRPAFTLRAGSGTFTALRPIHPYRNRVITVREAARLQSFPDRIELNPVKKWAYQGIGNSVPPRLAGALAKRLLDFLG